VPKELYEKIQTSARANGRTVSEEAVWRTQQSYEWEAARGTIQAWLAEARRRADVAEKLPVEQMLQKWGLTQIPAADGTEPKWAITNDATVREMREMAAMRAIERILRQS
jgi:hypothetical protein